MKLIWVWGYVGMSDSCHLEISILLRDAALLVRYITEEEEVRLIEGDDLLLDLLSEVFDSVENTPSSENKNIGPVVTCEVYEANYGYYNHLCEAANEGLTFFGGHGAGGNYSEAVFAACNYEISWPSVLEGIPIVQLPENLNPSSKAAQEVADYYRISRNAKEKMGVISKSQEKPKSTMRVIRTEA